jgi:hypothetical protein
VFHIVLILLVAVLTCMGWFLVHSAPRALSMILPPRLTFGIGAAFFVVGLFLAFTSAYVLKSPDGILTSLVQMYVGLWFMLATSAGARGSDDDERMMRRIFVMIGIVTAAIVGMLYVHDHRSLAVLNLILVTAGFWVTTNYLEQLHRGR